MKKVIISKDLEGLFAGKAEFLSRTGITLFSAATNDDLLNVHIRERAELIVAQLDFPGIRSEELFSIIRNSEDLRTVSVIIICRDTLAHRERCRQCRANAVFTIPVDVPLLYIKMHQFLAIAPRKSYRAALAVGIQGRFKDKPLPFWTENISASGMLIRSAEPLSKGDGTFFSFFLPNGAHVSGYGEISRVTRVSGDPGMFQYGIRFTNIEPEVKALIETTVSKGRRS